MDGYDDKYAMSANEDDGYKMSADEDDGYEMSADEMDNDGLEASRGMRRQRHRCGCCVNVFIVPMEGMAPMMPHDPCGSDDDPMAWRWRRHPRYRQRRPEHRY